MAKTRRIKKVTAGRYVKVVAYDQVLISDTPRARQAKRKASSHARQCLNYKELWKRAQMLFLANFHRGDLWVCLSYDDRHLPPNFEAAQALAKRYVERLRRQVAKTGAELRYMYNTETLNKDGSRRLHHHFVIGAAGVPAETVASLWTLGEVEVRTLGEDPMYSDDFIELAQYMTKERFPDTPGRKPGKRGFIPSKNLIKPTEESFLVEDTMTIAAPPGAKIVDQDHKDNEYGRFDYLCYMLPEPAKPNTKPKTKPRRKNE